MAVSIAAILLGTVLGVCFRVVVLIPFIVGVLAAISAAAVLLRPDVTSVLLVMAMTVTALQLGYLGGSFGRHLLRKLGWQIDGTAPDSGGQRR